MKRRLLIAASAWCCWPVAAVPRIEDHANQTPKLDLKTYLNGWLMAHGVFTDRAGSVVRRFTVQMQAHWQGDVGTLERTLSTATAARSAASGPSPSSARSATGGGRRRGGRGAWRGGRQCAALELATRSRLPVDGSVYEVDFDDWFYLMDDKVLLNKATMSKFGFKLGEVTLVFVKP